MDTAGIPKLIHYIWFGHGEKSELIQKCMKTTAEKMVDWTIKEWTEDNYDITKCDYCREAYEKRKYAFASDYARFDLLYRYGGIYLDTDVELLKKIPEGMLVCQGFTGVESNNKIAPGLIFASEAGNPIVREILDEYERDHFVQPDGKLNMRTVVDRVSEVFERHGFHVDGAEQDIEGIHVYPAEYFCAFDFVERQFHITDKTVSIHHYTATWLTPKGKIKRKVQNFFRATLGIRGYKKLIALKRLVKKPE